MMNPSPRVRPLPIVTASTERIRDRPGPHADQYVVSTEDDSVVDLRWIRGLAGRVCREPMHVEFVGPHAHHWAAATRAAIARRLASEADLVEIAGSRWE